MARRTRASRRRAGKADIGASWISYSDMMAALLLVFVLVLCYSVYQYFSMLESKSMELEEQSALLSEQATQLSQQEAALTAKQNELTGALSTIDEKQGLLDSQNLTLEEQESIILGAQAALKQKESDLEAAQQALATQQSQLDAASALLTSQQAAMSAQQTKLDNLVGVRTKIIQELSAGLTAAKVKASVDKNTGDIMLESAIFFDVGKSDIKSAGQDFLNEFIPVYLSVLLRPEHQAYLGEIIIEGHTDTQGEYLRNLELSQERALSVAAHCLQMRELNEEQRSQLRQILTAKGRSFSDPIYGSDGQVNLDASRRVEFKFRLKDSEMIDEIRSILAQ